MRVFGLIGKTLKHSFSQTYFQAKFERENIQDCQYKLFEIPSIHEISHVLEQENLSGLNVTIPYKQEIIPYLDTLSEEARRIGAVNVIHMGREKTGYNSDYYGFKTSLENWASLSGNQALILGTGGASKAVAVALEDLNITVHGVSRNKGADFTYRDLHENPDIIDQHRLIVNTTPLGMFPQVDDAPDIPYSKLTAKHHLYDLVYNPAETTFMAFGKSHGAQVKNGLEMLELQAEKSWEIWNYNS